MKFVLNLVVIAILGCIGYVAYPSVVTTLQNRDLLPQLENTKAGDNSTLTKAMPPTPAVPAPGTVTPAPAPTPVPAPVVPADAGDDAGIPMPTIKSLEEITVNWTMVPERAFPATVLLASEALFALGDGNSLKIAAGREVVPVALSADGMLMISPAAGSSVRTTIPVAQTDFKKRVTDRYNEGVARIKAGIEERRAKERARVAAVSTISPEIKAKAGDIPQSASDEDRYLAMMKKSVADGELPDITPDQVTKWRWIGYEDVGGQGYWTGAAVFSKSTLFGTFETEAKAFMRDGKVEKWALPGVDQ